MRFERINIFYDREYTPRILKLAFPVLLSMLSITVLINVDVMMVGRLGKEAVAATGLGGWVYLVVILTLSAIEVGTQVLVARRFGEKRLDECGRLTTIAMVISLTVGSGVLVLLFPVGHYLVHSIDVTVQELGVVYLRIRLLALPFSMSAFALRGFFYGIGNSVIPMITEIVINSLNIILNYILIFGKLGFPVLGVKGAALASFISTVIGFFILLGVILGRHYRKLYRFPAPIRKGIRRTGRDLFIISYPVFIQSFFIHLGFYLFLVINDLISVQAVAASNIAMSILCISFFPAFSFGIAAATLIGQKLGERRPEEAERYGWLCLGPGLIIMAIAGLVFILFGRELMSLYIQNPEVIELGAKALFLVGWFEVFDAIGIILSRGLQGAGLTRYVMQAEIAVNWLIFLPLAYILGVILGLGIVGTWVAMIAYILVFAWLMLKKFLSNDWKSFNIPGS